MTRLEKCELLKQKGYTYNSETGQIFGVYGKKITNKNKDGYIIISFRNGKYRFDLRGHHFAWYMTYGNVDFIELDHINEENKNIEGRSDNRICNLRITTRQENQFNSNAKGYTWDKSSNKWKSQIMLNRKSINLGLFNTEEEARNAYLEAKKKYHIIKNPPEINQEGLSMKT